MTLKDDLRAFRERSKLLERASNEAYFDLKRHVPLEEACDVCFTVRDPDELMYVNTASGGVATICVGVKRCRKLAERR